MDEQRYRVVRKFQDDSVEDRTIKTGLTLTEAQLHCRDRETSSSTATNPTALALTNELGQWNDVYEKESPGDYSVQRTGPGSRQSDLAFPHCLLVREANDNPRLLNWTKPHNRVVNMFISERRNDLRIGLPLKDNERAILMLAAGIDGWCSVFGADGFSGWNIVTPLFQAFSDALNYDLGRLDGGTLSNWSCDRLRSLGINPATYEPI